MIVRHSRITFGVIIVLLGLASFPGTQRAEASCGSATCPLNMYHSVQPGWIGLNIVHEYINQNEIYVGSSRSFIGAIREDHDEVQTLNERNVLRIQGGVFENFAVNLDVPFVHREHSHILHAPAGDQWESWNFTGLGDVVLTGSYSGLLNNARSSLSLTGGVKFASGVTDARNGEGELAEATIQPGTGSTDAVIGVNYRRALASVPTFDSNLFSELPLIAGVTYQVNGAGTDGYRFGRSLQAHLGTEYQFARRSSFLLQVNARFQDFADPGATDEPRENTGGTWLFVSPGLNLTLTDGLSALGYVQLPVYQNVHGIQQAAGFNLIFAMTYNFNLFEE